MSSPIIVTEKTAPEVVSVARRGFPSYSGRKFKICAFRGPMSLASCWAGGSRDLYALVAVDGSASSARASVPQNGSGFERIPDLELRDLPDGMALVEHTIFCGKDLGLTVYVAPENLASALPAPVVLSEDERAALRLVCSRTSAGRKDVLLGGIPYGPENPVIVVLAKRGLLKITRSGAVSATIDGKNADGAR